MGNLKRISKTYYLRQIVAYMIVYCILLAVPAQVVQANPVPPDGVGPSVGDYYSPTGTAITIGNTTTITAPDNGTVFDWENFDIGFGHTVEHLMESTHAVLHRINVTPRGGGDLWGDGAATGINGNLSAPGYLFVVNPMGIVICPQAYIQAQRFVASGLNILNFTDFINGVTDELQFEGYDPTTLGVELMAGGEIDASAVALVGKTVINNGTITSGSVVFAAGERIYLALTESSGNLVVDVTDLSTPTPSDHIVANAGTIDATGGNVLLAAGDIYSNAISGVENLAAKANRDIILFDNIQAGEIEMKAGQDVILSDAKTMDSDGMLTLEAENAIYLLGRVEAGGEGDVSLTTNSDNVTVTDVRALDDQITINSGGAILEYSSGDSGADLTAATLSLTAKTGITGQSPIETSATDITASTEAGNIDIDNTNGFATTASLAVTTGTGAVLFSQAGGGSLDVTSATTADGSIGIDVDDASLTAKTVIAGGDDVDDNVSLTTTTSGNVIVDDITAAGNMITINSAGSITEADVEDPEETDLVASVLDLDAATGIYGGSAIETEAATIDADTASGNIEIDNTGGTAISADIVGNGNIDIDNISSEPTTASTLTVGGDGYVLFSQSGGGNLTVTTATTGDGDIGIDVAEADLTALTVTAGGAGDVQLTTATSGDIKLGTVTALDNEINVDSAGSINDNQDDRIVDVTGGDLILTARDEIGGNPEAVKMNDTLGAIETTVGSLKANSTAGDIVIVETDNVGLHDVVAESGNIFLEATNGGMTYIDGQVEAGSSTLTLVQADDLDLADFVFGNQENTDLMVEITGGGFTADDTKPDNAADQWQSIQAKAVRNIVLQGSDDVEDIKIGTHEGFESLSHPFGGVVKSSMGGVSIISENGAVRTADDSILDDVEIAGVSDHYFRGIGVDLPCPEDNFKENGRGKAAIIIMSDKDLVLGPDTTLTAGGRYYNPGDTSIFGDPFPTVDDRPCVDCLDTPAEIPVGFPRKQGDPFDVAIYLASTGEGMGEDTGEGNVEVDSKVSITSMPLVRVNGDGPELEFEAKGAMVIDAYYSVTFGDLFEESLAGDDVDSDVGDRLEVISRITEWLFQSIGRLPYPYGGGPFPPGYNYVVRGAGLENPGITDGRAWVLEDPTEWAPFGEELIPEAEETAFAEGGCPVLMEWLAAELGIPEEFIRVYLEYAFVYSTDVQPCEACERLLAAATILEDAEGTQIAALASVVNEFVAPDAPIAPEQIASITSAVASPEPGTHYAAAGEWLDSLAEYVGILSTEMGFSASESVAFVDKYITPITEGDNVNLFAYVEARLAALGE